MRLRDENIVHKRLSECVCITSSDKTALRSALTRAKDVVEKKLKEEEKRVPRFGVLEKFYRKDLIDC